MVGICYSQGQGVVKDESKAAHWFAAAAAQGHADAQYNLGLCFALVTRCAEPSCSRS
jgi:TPR repeat protein